jgi:polyisoprenoid-binding protein YceI
MKNRMILLLLATAALSVTACNKSSEAAPATDAAAAKPATVAATTYTVDTTTSVITWSASKPTGRHNGTIKLSGGSASVKNDSLDTGNFVINMKSITVLDLKDATEKKELEGHLKGNATENKDHFFNTDKYPTCSFEITSIRNKGPKAMIEGNLTLKGTSKNIKFPATVTVSGPELKIVSDEFKINRTLWNVNYGSKNLFDNLGNQYIDDDITLNITVIAKK